MTGGDAAAVPQSEEHAGQGAVLLSINVGLPQEVGWEGRTVYTGVFKHPVPGPRMVRRLNIDGDGQGDTAGHGGEQRAVLVYQIESYRYWEQHLGRADLTSGMFGENFTVEGLADDAVCIGDRYRIGEVEFEVTQLRVTCFRVGMRLGEPELPALLVGHHCPGFYLRTVEPAWSGFRPLRVTTIVPETPTVVSILLISGGIGVTPVLAMLPQLAAERSGRDVWWIHGARSPREHPLAAEAHTLVAALPNAHEHVFYSAATPDECRRARATAGRVSEGRLGDLGVPADASAYVCGPAAFMTEVEAALTRLGIAPSRIHTERFGALPPINPGLVAEARRPPHPPLGPPGTGPLVTFARSGISAPYGTQHKSVLELADACDISTRWSCRTGVCHTCGTPLLSGTVSYRPSPLELPAEGEVLLCCARPDTDIVLDM